MMARVRSFLVLVISLAVLSDALPRVHKHPRGKSVLRYRRLSYQSTRHTYTYIHTYVFIDLAAKLAGLW